MRPTLPAGVWNERVVLAGLFAAIGMTAAAFSALAPVPSRYDGADAAVAVASALAALASLRAPRTWDSWVVQVELLFATVLITVLVGVRSTAQGQSSVGYLLALASLCCAVYLTHGQMLAQVGLLCVLFALASQLGIGDLEPFYVGLRIATVLVIAEVVSRLVARQRNLVAEIQLQALRDPLTGALNRRGAVQKAEDVRSLADRAGRPTTVSVIDLDEFKAYNDGHGHAAGDRLLVDLTTDWTSILRTGDVLARVGGDEFVVVLPQTDLSSAEVLLARMRDVNRFAWSVGTVDWRSDEDLFAATARADDLLYADKVRRRAETA